MKIKLLKLIYVFLLITLLILVPTKTQALGDILDSGKKFIDAGKNEDSIINETKLDEVSNNIYNVLLVIAVIVAVSVGAFLGIQLMMQGAEGKAQIKEALLPYAIGCIVSFGAFGIWKVVVLVAQNLEM